MKTCTKCKQELPVTLEFFYAHKRGKYGLQSQCKQCYCKISNVYYATTKGYLRRVYASMKQRCTNTEHISYKYYGARGIKCLFTPDAFVNYVVNTLKVDPRGLQIDRIDNDGDYEPGNIRFVTRSENCQNKRKKT
ncbi:hypothetical protein LCGC14_2862090 [marine sediment metagenome]|uniref:Uncharacterized protein n=1 Tax=marine sediment metagenome TaxID=412755 RepID=A0A0F8Y584_9ZZZZ